MERIPNRELPSKVAFAMLGLASLATIATDCADPYHVRRLVPYQGAIYTSWHGNIAMSDDGGQRWQIANSVSLPSNILDSLEQSVELPMVACAPENDQLCYRVAGEEIVEISEDGGKTWQVTWKIPSGRRAYMDRFSDVRLCVDAPNMGPFDLVVLENGNLHSVVVAMGNQGVLVRSNGKDWEHIEVLQFSATPTPFRAQSPGEILLALYLEASLLLIISILILVGSNTWGLARLLKFPRVWPTVIFAALVASLTAISIHRQLRFSPYYPSEMLVLSLILTGIWIIISLVRKPKEAHTLGCISIRIALESLLLGSLPLVFWTIGIIPWYGLALVVSVCLVILIIFSGIRRMWKALQADELGSVLSRVE